MHDSAARASLRRHSPPRSLIRAWGLSHAVRMRVVARIAALVSLAAGLSGCAGTECSQLDCSDHAIVSLPLDLVDGAYDLVVESEHGTLVARCLQAPPPEGPANSPELSCTATEFEIDEGDVASAREIRVTITDVDTGEVLAEAVDVTLEVAMEITPNGPDCEPICYERNGQLLVDGLPG